MNNKSILAIIIYFLCSAYTLQTTPPVPIHKWVINKTGSLLVKGSTNVNTFNCIVLNYTKPDTITLFKSNSSNQVINLSGDILIDIQSFDCHNNMMTAELRKILKAKTYPQLKIHFISLAKAPTFKQAKENIKGLVSIELANITKRYEVDFQFTIDEQKNIHLVGTRNVNFSDFDIIPPTKLGGMIKTNNQLGIEFHLQLKEID